GWAAIAAASAVLILAADPAAAEWVDWIADGDLGFRYDSNVNHAGFSSEREHDWIWRPKARLGRIFQFAGSTRFEAVAEIRGEIHHRWTDLDAVSGDGQLSLSHKFGMGDAPWARVFFSGGYEGMQDSERSGSRFAVGAQAGKRFSPRFDASLSYRFTARDGDNGRRVLPGTRTDIWDQQYHEVVIDGRFLVTEQLLATAGYGFRHGDLYSNARGKLMLVLMEANAKAVARDAVFGGWSYRLVGNAHSPFVSLNYGLGDRWSIDASYRFRYAKSDSLAYTNHITQLTVLFRY
ncbi:MAG: hypothetical protein ACE5FL_02555, partial [Myxococcota bacterium]